MASAYSDQRTISKIVGNSYGPQVTDLVTTILTIGNQPSNSEQCYFVPMRSLQDGIKKMLKEASLLPEEAAERIGMHPKSIYRWLRKTDTFQEPDRALLNKLADVCNYQITRVETNQEVYFLFTNKNKESEVIQHDIQLLLNNLDAKRLSAIRTFMLCVPEFSEETVEIITRYINDVARIEATRAPMKKVG